MGVWFRRATWHVQVPRISAKPEIKAEMSSCECLEGTRLTDEKRYPSEFDDLRAGKLCGEFLLPDQPGQTGRCFPMPGRWKRVSLIAGRDVRLRIPYDIPVELEENTELVIETDDGGCIIYGNRMGRYGCDPMFFGRGK